MRAVLALLVAGLVLCLASGQTPSDAQAELATKIRSNVVRLWNATWAQGGKCAPSNMGSG